ncbi:hypothetical protein JCM8547_005775 [Rhodosporidiobolus lusitaniae]
MDQSSLEALLATLRTAQGAGEPAPTALPSVAPAPQSDLDALLWTLTALPDAPKAPTPSAQQQQRRRDTSAMTFQEAVPLLNSLAADPNWLDRVEQVWDEQKNWELALKDERNRFEGDLKRENVPSHTQAVKLREWDRNALKRWDALQGKQQEQLQDLGVPTFQKTTDSTILKRQERVLAVLIGFLEDRDG